jgi:hypothetical protein
VQSLQPLIGQFGQCIYVSLPSFMHSKEFGSLRIWMLWVKLKCYIYEILTQVHYKIGSNLVLDGDLNVIMVLHSLLFGPFHYQMGVVPS